MSIFCSKCGHENLEDSNFCEHCGQKLEKPDTDEVPFNGAPIGKKEDAADGNKEAFRGRTKEKANDRTKDSANDRNKDIKKKRLIIIITAIVLIIAVGVTATIVLNNRQKTAEYNDKVIQADRYLEDMEYDKAEKAYLEAIDIKPKEEKPYLRVADIYIENNEYDKAEKILTKADKNVASENVKTALSKLKTHGAYEKLISEEVSDGYAHVGEEYHRGEYEGGLISALQEDINNDDVLELITVSYGNGDSTQLTIVLYSYNDGEAELMDEKTIDFDDAGYAGVQYDVFLKKKRQQTYICIKEYQAISPGEILEEMKIYRIDENRLEDIADALFYASEECFVFNVNDDTVSEYAYGDGDSYDSNDYQIAWDNGFERLDEELKVVDVVCDRDAEENGSKIPGYDEKDETQVHICYVQHGKFTEENYVNFEMTDLVYIEDYTGTR